MVERNMYKWRERTLPPLPPVPQSVQQLSDILNSEEYNEWTRFNGGSFTVSPITDNNQFTSVIFIDVPFAREIIANNDVLYCDATYKVKPTITDAYQLLTFMIKFNHGFPISYALMESKSQSAYETVLTEVRRVLPQLNVTAVMTDFEIALQNAIQEHFPESEARRCFFHYIKKN
ncbi:uncharacterized protein LOC122508752 [Leptopilina heterotoma]|uniref:uncharacterized protein LOC122508752 n=1 Tax=Leptopilina heterotoma TaxID=63436 RepID=UPI001CA8646B|nr:uncharacterized protein LOC122508752 [Leptopilina heterotoma]